MRKYFAILGLLALLIPLILGGMFQMPSVLAQEPDASHKISSLLAIQVEAKVRAIERGGLPPAVEEGRVDVLQVMGMEIEDLHKQRIFIHLAQEPSQSQIAELQSLGLTLYPDSWIPPLKNHPTGFIIADMPIDKLEPLAGKNYVVRLDTAERFLEPQNYLATQKIRADDVWTAGYDGTGVAIAVLDSGLDVNHGDLPASFTSKDYDDYPTLDDTIANTTTGHGTHVTGSALGRGTQSSGVYKGSAPDADLIFLKIGNDTTGSASTAAIVGAMQDAVDTYSADVITMSYGGWSTYHDGTSQTSQAVDYAVSQGAVVFISAGNAANDDRHYSGTVAANTTTGFIQIDVTGASVGDTALWFNLVWYDGTSTSNVLSAQLYNNAQNSISTFNDTQSESTRGTEARQFYYGTSGSPLAVTPGSRAYYVKVTNSSDTSQDFHIYVWIAGGGSVTFNAPDLDYTISSPADADSAIAVGAYTTRDKWWDYDNEYDPGGWTYGETLNQISSFSSRGPRVDTGAPPKPNIVAPGSVIISARDDDVYPWSSRWALYIDNNGPNEYDSGKNDGTGPADYYVMQGTSMASPIAAGVGALILDKNPTWTPAQVRHALESTATDKGTLGRDDTYGWGLIDAYAAVNSSLPALESYKVGYPGDQGSQQEDIFDEFATENTVYMYSTGLLPSHNYRMVYYEGDNDKRATEDVASDASGNLSTQHTFIDGTDAAGTWNVIVIERDFTPPDPYNSSWEYMIASDTFTVQASAIPEFPTVLAAMVALALSAGVYFWMRRKAAPVPA